MKKYIKINSLIIPVLIFLIWELLTNFKDSPVYFPPISSILKSWIVLIKTPSFLADIASTLYRCFLGFIISSFIAIPLGLLLGWKRKIYVYFEFIIEFFRPLPSASVIPIAILFLGIDNNMKIFVIAFGSFWPILINSIDGVRDIEPQFFKTAKVFKLSNFKFLAKVIFPSALPQIFTGLKISVAISLILAITVEMIVGGDGIGYFIIDTERSFQFKNMYAGILTIGIIGYIINILLLKLEKWIIFWK